MAAGKTRRLLMGGAGLNSFSHPATIISILTHEDLPLEPSTSLKPISSNIATAPPQPQLITMLRQLAKKSSSKQQSCHKLLLKRLQSSVTNISSSTLAAPTDATKVATAVRTLSSLQIQNQPPVEGYAMKALVDTLQVALISPHLQAAPPLVTASPQMIMPPPEFMMKVEEEVASEQIEEVVTSTKALVDIEEAPPATNTKSQPNAPRGRPQIDHELSIRAMKGIQQAMDTRDVRAVFKGVEDAVANPQIILQQKFFLNCFQFMTPVNPLYAYDIMRMYDDHYTVTADMYVRMCGCIRNLDNRHGPASKSKKVVLKLMKEIQARLSPEDRQRTLPLLLLSSGKTSIGSVRSACSHVYRAISADPEVELNPEYLELIVRNSKFWSTDYMPYHELMQLFADTGSIPYQPHSFSSALTNLFPFKDIDQVLTAVTALHQIVRNCEESDDPKAINAVRVDMGLLEQIMAAAARKGAHPLCLATWDLCESLGYRPTETFYECMIQAFAMGYRKDLECFACLADMESSGGFTPSRSLIRSLSRSLRFSVNRCDNAYRCIIKQCQGCRPTQASLNAIMSACAELGEVDRTFSVLLDDFPKPFVNAVPNEDSFSFAMESLAVAAQTDLEQQVEKEDVDVEYDTRRLVRLEAAEQLLNWMEERSMAINAVIFHEYIRLLISSNELEVATQVALDAKDTNSFDVANKTLMFLVNGHTLENGDFEMARGLVGRMTESFDFLYRRIEKRELRRNNRLAEMADADTSEEHNLTRDLASAESLSVSTDTDDEVVGEAANESTTEPVVV